jgi:hypothetical protein
MIIDIAMIKLALSLATTAYQLGKEAAPYIKLAYEIQFKNKILTDDERKAMTDQELAWRAEIDAVIDEDNDATD